MTKTDIGYSGKKALPNKLLQADGSITDIAGNVVVNAVEVYNSKPALPNKFLNPDGTYSTLSEIIAGIVDTSIYVIVDELPTEGNPQKIYLLPAENGKFNEYHWTGTIWDPIGMLEFDIENYLSKTNTTAYTPTGDYNPATKKYVDDAITTNITNALSGSY